VVHCGGVVWLGGVEIRVVRVLEIRVFDIKVVFFVGKVFEAGVTRATELFFDREGTREVVEERIKCIVERDVD
jgi:hypothetical protein